MTKPSHFERIATAIENDRAPSGQWRSVLVPNGDVPFVHEALRIAADQMTEREKVVADEIGWLIESQWDRPMWLSLSKSVPGYWTPDSLKATRFARRVDAEDWLASQEVVAPNKVTITEHIWSGDHSSAKPAGDGR